MHSQEGLEITTFTCLILSIKTPPKIIFRYDSQNWLIDWSSNSNLSTYDISRPIYIHILDFKP